MGQDKCGTCAMGRACVDAGRVRAPVGSQCAPAGVPKIRYSGQREPSRIGFEWSLVGVLFSPTGHSEECPDGGLKLYFVGVALFAEASDP